MDPNQRRESPLERELCDLRHPPLPEAWRAEMIDNAICLAPVGGAAGWSTVRKVAVLGLAACWVAIGVLRITTPDDGGSTGGGRVAGAPGSESAARAGVPLLVRYIESRTALSRDL